jgi:hypothetical protein
MDGPCTSEAGEFSDEDLKAKPNYKAEETSE